MDYICVSEHSQCKELLVERWKISNLIRAETFTSLHFTSQDTIYTWCRNEFYRNDNACIDLHRFALPCFTFIWYFRSRMLLLTAALMVTAFTEVCRAETDQRYFPQETNWISEKVVLYISHWLLLTIFISVQELSKNHILQKLRHTLDTDTARYVIVYCPVWLSDKPDHITILTRSRWEEEKDIYLVK